MAKKKIVFQYGRETKLPKRVIEDAPGQGPFDEYADYLCSQYDVQVTLQDSQLYLKRIGAWELEELADVEVNKRRLLWIACLDCKDNKTCYWFMGE